MFTKSSVKALAIVVALGCMMRVLSPASAEEPTLQEIANQSRARAKRDSEEKIRIILHRQTGDQLKVYLNSRGAYVNGKSVSRDELVLLATQSDLSSAVVTAEAYLDRQKVRGWQDLIRQAGIKKIGLTTPKQRIETEQEKLREILSRQKGDQIKVYLKGTRGIYVNGKSVSTKQLVTLVRESGLAQIAIAYAPLVARKRVAEIERVIREAGGDNVELTTSKAK